MENLENIHNIAETHDTDLQVDGTVTTTAADVTAPDSDLARMLEEAEQRGYMRGRNERIEEIVMKPLYDDDYGDDSNDDDSCPGFLTHLRPGFWDDI